MLGPEHFASSIVVNVSKAPVIVPGELLLHEMNRYIERGELMSSTCNLCLHLVGQNLDEEFNEMLVRHAVGKFGPYTKPFSDV